MATHTLCKTLRLFNYTRGISCHLNLLCINTQRLQYKITPEWNYFDSKKSYSDIPDTGDPPVPKKKKLFVPRITLLSETNEMTVVTLEEAQKLSKRRNLKLVKIVDFDTKSERAIYKLMRMNDFLDAETKSKAEAKEARNRSMKDEKTMTVSSKISENDLGTKIKSINKMLGKKHGVRIIISIDGNKERAVEIADSIIADSKDVAKVATKSSGGLTIKVILRPVLEQTNENTTENSNSSNDDTK
ncbi:hypothetical protein PV327_001058 [Microctonus hyperodae]|uniref:Translation initiation factor IF-3 n=1 Tax=Microctonus hyperodae TaxID=165561 RepID=A0AA39L2T3_MICHY|nr:hypothetical protein PV327_001058 [Microctonus hyperodae]